MFCGWDILENVQNIERKTKYEKVMPTLGENEQKSLMQLQNRCLV